MLAPTTLRNKAQVQEVKIVKIEDKAKEDFGGWRYSILVSEHLVGAAAWMGGQKKSCEITPFQGQR